MLVVGAIEQLVALPGPALMMVAKAVAADPTCTERLTGNTAELRLGELLVLLPGVNEALTDMAVKRRAIGTPDRHPIGPPLGVGSGLSR